MAAYPKLDREDIRAVVADAADLLAEEDRRRRVLEEANAAYALLRSDPEAWQEILAERAEWEDLREDLEEEAEDLAAIQERSGERGIPFEDVVQDLRRRGQI